MAGRRRTWWSTWWGAPALGAGALALAHLLDGWAFRSLTDAAAMARITGEGATMVEGVKPVTSREWYQMLRQLGSVWPWLLLALTLWLIENDRREQGRRGGTVRGLGGRAGLIVSAVLAAGALAEVLKPFIGRKRPEDTLGQYEFFSLSDAFSNWSDCGIPSSHGAVSFAGALAVAAFHPRAGWVLVPLACGTCWTRVANGNHFLSDVVAGAVIAALTVKALKGVLGVDR